MINYSKKQNKIEMSKAKYNIENTCKTNKLCKIGQKNKKEVSKYTINENLNIATYILIRSKWYFYH